MPKKTTILIVILAIITGILIFLAVKSDQTQTLFGNKVAPASPTPTVMPSYASLGFSQPQLDATLKTTNQKVDITIDTQGKSAATAQIELTYDPKVITDVKVSTPAIPFFGTDQNVLINAVDPAQGRISYATGISLQGTEKVGTGTVATLIFSIVKASGTTSSQITFLPKSAVTTLSTPKSILQTTVPLTIILSK